LGTVQREAYSKVIGLLQSNSPEAQLGKDGAKGGMFTFRGTENPYRASFIGVPVFEHVRYVEWPPERMAGAIPVENHSVKPADATPDASGDWRMPNDNRVVKTRYVYIALANAKGQLDFTDLWALPITSTGFKFFDQEFAAQFPVTITVDGKEIQGPMAAVKWKFSSELTSNARGSWFKIKYTMGSKFGQLRGPTWDELVRGAEIEAEMKKADLLARGAQPAEIEAKANAPGVSAAPMSAARIGAAAATAATAARGKVEITSGRAACNPSPPVPPPIDLEASEGPGEDEEEDGTVPMDPNDLDDMPF
jgi:hypothetical protein